MCFDSLTGVLLPILPYLGPIRWSAVSWWVCVIGGSRERVLRRWRPLVAPFPAGQVSQEDSRAPSEEILINQDNLPP